MSKTRGPYRVDPLGHKKKADEALDKKAENARELGLDYEPVQCKYPKCNYPCPDLPDCRDAEQPAQQEPVAYLVDGDLYYPEEIDWETLQEQGHTVAALYTSPLAQRKPLTFSKLCDIEYEITHRDGDFSILKFARAIEAAHGIKGEA